MHVQPPLRRHASGFRSLYVAELPETALREVLADLHPKAAAIRRYVEQFGPDAADDVPALPVSASWRQQHVLVQVRAVLDGPLIDLCDADVRYQVELEHAELLDAHGMDHLDLSEITADKRPVTQTSAADLHDNHGAAGIRFPSRLDGNACLVVFEERGQLEITADPIQLTDPAPSPLQTVCAGWRLTLQPATALVDSE
jgi:hypothetical protein